MAFSIPDDKGKITQPNNGDSVGNIFMSYNLDLESNASRVGISEQVKKLVTDADNPDFAGYAGSIGRYSPDGVTGKIFAVSDKAFSADNSDPFGTWTEETTGAEPDSGNTVMDSVFFDSLFLVSEASNIKSWNGTTWASWWQGTLGQSALATGERHLMKVGSDGNLYIVDNGNLLYRVTPTGTITKTGDGSLDFSATNYLFTCLAVTSTRLFIGTIDKTGEEAAILEWDMSPSSATVNRIHKIGAKGVRCIAVWNDTPIAILSNGNVKYFNGLSFTEFDKVSVQFPTNENYELSEDFIHPNGWAIIDDLPHFLVTGRTDTSSVLTATKQASYYMPAGIWCLDPAIGLYHRFALGTGASTQEDYGKMSLSQVGALYSLQNTSSKFLASYQYYLDTEAGQRSVLVYHDAANSQAGRGFLMTPFLYNLRSVWKTIEMFHKELASGEKIKLYYRTNKDEVLAQSIVWADTNTANITGISLGIAVGDVAFIKTGAGAGQLLQVASINESSTITEVTFSESNSFATAGDLGSADFLNFKYLGTVDDTTRDYHSFSVPEFSKKRKTQFLIEYRQAASNKMEQDFVIINE